MTDYIQEQEMEIEALRAILMDDIKEIHPGESGINTSNPCFQILLSPEEDNVDESSYTPVQLAFFFSHTQNYPDEPPLLNVQSIRGIKSGDMTSLKNRLIQEASENLGMAMVYTLITSAKEWLNEHYGQNDVDEDTNADEAAKDDIIIPHGEPVTVETFLAWRERVEAEMALKRAKLIPESALVAPKEKKLTGRQWFASETATAKGTEPLIDGTEEEEDEDIDFDEDFEDDDEEDMLEHYLAEKTKDGSSK